MRKFVLLIALVAGGMALQATSNGKDSEKGINFYQGDWQSALQKAEDEGKLIYFHGYTTWCGPCNRMKRDVYTTQSIGEFFNKNFINIKVDMEKGEGRQLAGKYHISSYPTLMFLNSKGEVVKRTKGYHDERQLMAFGEQVLD